jgi:hypothetical protein
MILERAAMKSFFVLRIGIGGLGLLCAPVLSGCKGEVLGDWAEVAPPAPAIAISEVMYHPVLDDSDDEPHEFIELHNPATTARDLAGFRLLFGDQEVFRFPAGASISAGGYLVVAKSRTRLAPLHQLSAQDLQGDYAGALDNGGQKITLLDAGAKLVDTLRYDDDSPWPVGADALGKGASWFPAGEYEKQRFAGRSLERRSFQVSGSEPRNWEASALGGGSPGRANAAAGEPPALVTALTAQGPRAGAITKSDRVTVRAALSEGTARALTLEYFVDDVAKADATESKTRVDLPAGAAPSVELPALPAQSIVRYRVIERDSGAAVAPRAGDPSAYRAYFVEADTPAPPGSYQLFIAPAAWGSMWSTLGPGPNGGCDVNAGWDARVPAVVVHDGHVYDVLARYQGSRYNRRNGFPLPALTYSPAGRGPTQPASPKALSWHLSFPRYDRFDKRSAVTLNKQYQACPGTLNLLESKLYWAAGVRTQRFRFARLYVNGAYYHYMMEVEGIDEDLMSKADDGAPLGDLFKSDGAVDDSGPWGRGNFRPLADNGACPGRWSMPDRYRFTYERQSHDWKDATPAGHAPLIAVIDGLRPLYEAAKASNDWGPVRAHFEKHFDVAQLITHWAIRNFAGVWDDGIHNFYLYRRATDDMFEAYPQDFDLDFGGDTVTREADGRMRWNFSRPPESSIFAGEEGVGEPVGGANALKSALIKAFRVEFRARLAELLRGGLAKDNVMTLLSEATAGWDQKAWDESPAVGKCDAAARVESARTWLNARYVYLASQGLM